MNFDSLSHSDRTMLLAYIAHQLTVSARSTYVPGTVDIAEPQALRAYNELMHQITSSICTHIKGKEGMSLEVIVEKMYSFGRDFNKIDEIDWVLKSAQEISKISP